eukprot:1469460-Pyramimonas_sp.AAC.1
MWNTHDRRDAKGRRDGDDNGGDCGCAGVAARGASNSHRGGERRDARCVGAASRARVPGTHRAGPSRRRAARGIWRVARVKEARWRA